MQLNSYQSCFITNMVYLSQALQLSQKRNEDEGDCEDSIICLGTIEPN